MAFELIIWDCDGVLVDSEVIACEEVAKGLSAAGYPVSGPDVAERFAGSSSRDMLERIRKEIGKDIAASYRLDEIRAAITNRFVHELLPMAGVHDALRECGVLGCVASGSPPPRVNQVIDLTGLRPFFAERLFSATQVEHGKPAPDLFLLAAKSCGAEPQNCLVIEDSPFGVQAAKAAGMSVYAFFGGSHITPLWRERVLALQPDWSFEDMRALKAKVGVA